MIEVPIDDEFDVIVSEALDSLPEKYTSRLANIAIVYEDEPSLEQRHKLQLHCNQTLLGLYEGVPLSRRGGREPILPDKITLFKVPLAVSSADLTDLQQKVRHTLWHEMAHYFGLGHDQIHKLEA